MTFPCTGKYQIEAWGAQGASGGAGSYSSGVLNFYEGDILYAYVGKSGSNGGYNGGGQTSYKGGGSTDVRLIGGNWNDSKSLASRILVAAGGAGGADNKNALKGQGGTLVGIDGSYDTRTSIKLVATGATQTTGGLKSKEYSGYYGNNGTNGSFGKGGNADISQGYSGGSGGGGYYGGGGGSMGYSFSGSGGSSYISGHIGCVAIISEDNISPKEGCNDGTSNIECSYHYSGKIFKNTIMKSGVESMPSKTGSSSSIGNSGDGYLKITFLG